MSSIDQYVDLWRANADAIDSHSAHALNALRPRALETLTRDGASLPNRKTEGFEKTSLEEMFAPDFGINVNRVNLPVDLRASLGCTLPHVSTLLGVNAGDIFSLVGETPRRIPEGVTFMSLAQAAKKFPDLVAKYYGKLAPIDDPSVALNTLLAQDGVFIHVDPGVDCAKTLQVVNLFNSEISMMAVRRMLVVVEEGASLKLLACDHTQTGSPESLASQVIEVFAMPNSRVEIYEIEESAPSARRRSQMFLRQEKDSYAVITNATLTCGSTRNDFIVDIVGQHAETFIGGMAIASADMHIDNNTDVAHNAPRSRSNQLFKYVLDDNASGAFEGSILVADGAKFTEAYQANKNIIASHDASMHTKPQLEIYNDDVKCSHGATTGQLDEKALFYMQTRGIPREEARRMLMQAFMDDIIETVKVPELRDRLRHLVERRFSAGDMCAACHI